MNENAKIIETEDYGVMVQFVDSDLADEFDDFISTEVYVLANMKVDLNHVDFYFGRASSLEKVQIILDEFKARLK